MKNFRTGEKRGWRTGTAAATAVYAVLVYIAMLRYCGTDVVPCLRAFVREL